MRRAALFLLVALPFPALAHFNTQSASRIRVGAGAIEVELRVRDADLCMALEGADADGSGTLEQGELDRSAKGLEGYFTAACEIEADGRRLAGKCLGASKVAQGAADGAERDLNVLLRLSYPMAGSPRGLDLAFHPFGEIDFLHQHTSELHLPGREPSFLFFDLYTRLRVELDSPARKEAPVQGVSGMFWIGARHLAAGWDHLLFLAALLVASRDPWRLAGLVTGFTAGHTLTLVLAGLGWVSLPRGLTESAIAGSIAWAGIQNLRGQGAGCAWWQVSLFGLVHGLGFAGDLRGILPPDRLVASLLAFNLGIEAAQLALVLAAWPCLYWGLRFAPLARRGRGALSAAIAAAGLWLLAVRVNISPCCPF